jgi:hypothetical protein
MFRSRITRLLIATTGLSGPILLSWLWAIVLMNTKDAQQMGTPNPSRALWLPDPAEVLVYSDPYFAGTGIIWYFAGALGAVILALWSALLHQELRDAQQDLDNKKRYEENKTNYSDYLSAAMIHHVLSVPFSDVTR